MQLRSGIMGSHVVYGQPTPPQRPAAARAALSGISMQLARLNDKSRDAFEAESKVMKQCESVLPPINTYPEVNHELFGRYSGFARCWLCSFPVGHTSFLRYLQQNPIGRPIIPITSLAFAAWTYKSGSAKYSSSSRVRDAPDNDIFDRATCEHVLPVKLAALTLGLAQVRSIGLDVHTEYEYAHNYCNYVKNKTYFITLPLTDRTFDNLTVNPAKITSFVDSLIYEARGEGAQFMDGRVSVNGQVFSNIVQAYLYIAQRSDAANTAIYKNLIIRAITERTQRVIDRMKVIDQRSSKLPDGSTMFYTYFRDNFHKAAQNDFTLQQQFLHQIQQQAPEFLSSQTVPLQRAPSSAQCRSYEDCINGFTVNPDVRVEILENMDLAKSSHSNATPTDIIKDAIQDTFHLIDPNTGTKFLVEDIDAQGGRRNRRHKKTQRKRRAHKKRRATRSKK
jgi:hypothetical protein